MSANRTVTLDGASFHDVTLTHGSLVPWVFPSVRDVKLPGSLYFVTERAVPEKPIAIAYLASPFATERPDFVCDYYLFDEKGQEDILALTIKGLKDLARQYNAPSLRVMKPVTTAWEARVLEREQFYVELESIQFAFSATYALGYIKQQLQTRFTQQSLPDDVKVVDYGGPLRDQISKLCVKEFGAMTHGHMGALGQLDDGMDHSFSRAVSLKGQLVSSLGVGVKGKLAIFEPLLISPDVRGSWAFPFVVNQVLTRVVESGVEDARALIHSSNKKIMNFMQHLDPEILGSIISYKIDFDFKKPKEVL